MCLREESVTVSQASLQENVLGLPSEKQGSCTLKTLGQPRYTTDPNSDPAKEEFQVVSKKQQTLLLEKSTSVFMGHHPVGQVSQPCTDLWPVRNQGHVAAGEW